jgi:hypothetical protein
MKKIKTEIYSISKNYDNKTKTVVILIHWKDFPTELVSITVSKFITKKNFQKAVDKVISLHKTKTLFHKEIKKGDKVKVIGNDPRNPVELKIGTVFTIDFISGSDDNFIWVDGHYQNGRKLYSSYGLQVKKIEQEGGEYERQMV